MLHRFDSVADASRAGYVKATASHKNYRECKIYNRDTSGGSSFGYSFAITVSVPNDIDDYTFNYLAEDFGSSVQVWTNDLNQIGQPGSFCVMYAPDTLATAIKRAHEWVDAYYAANPDSAARLAEYETERAAIDARQTAKVNNRRLRIAARQSAAAL